jgi:hypothetical protein
MVELIFLNDLWIKAIGLQVTLGLLPYRLKLQYHTKKKFSEVKHDLNHICVFGCKMFNHIFKYEHKKL